MMKRFAAGTVLLAMLAVWPGTAVFGGETVVFENVDEIAVNEGPTLTVGYVKIGAESDWRMACNKSLADTFTIDNGYFLLTSDAQQKQDRQVKAVREFISQEVDYILLDPITESGWAASLEEAREAGIPVIVFDREVDVDDPEAYTAWLGSDFYTEGARASAWLEAYLEESGYEGEVGIVHIQGTTDSSAQIGRTRGLDEALEKHPQWELLGRADADFTTAKGKEVMVEMLEEFGGRINVVYCENDNEAYGAIEAIEEAGFSAGTDLEKGDILVLSFDAANNGLMLTMEKKIAVNTECAPCYGPLLTQMIMALERGEELPKRQYVYEQQFSALGKPDSVTVSGRTWPVAPVSEELISARPY